MDVLPLPMFPGVSDPSSNFDSTRQALRCKPFCVMVDLSVARTVNSMLNLPIAGNVLYIDQRAGTGTARLHFQDQTPLGCPLTVFAGFMARIPFTQIAIENDAQPGLWLQIVFGTDLDFIPSNAAGVSLLNAVSVVDGGLIMSIAGSAFWMGGSLGASVGNFGMIALWNMPGSGKKLIVNQVSGTLDTAGGIISWYEQSAALANLGTFGRSKVVGGASSVAGRMASDTLAAPTGTGVFADFVLPASPRLVPITEPLVLPPGTGFAVVSPVNTAFRAFFQWNEIGA